jgi:hypothetical protein
MLMTYIFEVVNYNTCSMQYIMSKAFCFNIFTIVYLYNYIEINHLVHCLYNVLWRCTVIIYIDTNDSFDSKFIKYEGGNKTFYPGNPTVGESFSSFTPVA